MKLQKLSNTWSEIFISFVNKERANALINSATEPRIIDKKPTQYFSAHFSIFNMQNNKWILSESYIPHGDRIIICICFFSPQAFGKPHACRKECVNPVPDELREQITEKHCTQLLMIQPQIPQILRSQLEKKQLYTFMIMLLEMVCGFVPGFVDHLFVCVLQRTRSSCVLLPLGDCKTH